MEKLQTNLSDTNSDYDQLIITNRKPQFFDSQCQRTNQKLSFQWISNIFFIPVHKLQAH